MDRIDLCLLMTSSIKVADQRFLKRTDTRVRLEDYSSALRKWLTGQDVIQKIVFADNSGHSLNPLRKIAEECAGGKEVEFLSFRTEGYTLSKGRSYGELDILEKALERSALLSKVTHFAKVTGRVFVPNIGSIVRRLPGEFDVVSRFSHNLAWMDTVLFLVRRELFSELILPGSKECIDDQNKGNIERVLAKRVLHCITRDFRWFPFSREPVIHGILGYDNRPYPRGYIRSGIRNLISKAYHRISATASGETKKHLLDRWGIPPDGKGEPGERTELE